MNMHTNDCPKCHGFLIRDYMPSDATTLGMTPYVRCVNCGYRIFNPYKEAKHAKV